MARMPSSKLTGVGRPPRRAEKKPASWGLYPRFGKKLDLRDSRLPRTSKCLKSCATAPNPGPKTSTRSPPLVFEPTVQYVRLATDPRE